MPPPRFPPPTRSSPAPPPYQDRSRSFPSSHAPLTHGAGCRSHPLSRFAHSNHCQCLSSDLPEFHDTYEFPPDTYPVYPPNPFCLDLQQPSSSIHPARACTTSSASSALTTIAPSTPHVAYTGCTGLLLRLSNFPALSPSFTPNPLPQVPFTLPDHSILTVGGPSHLTGELSFPHKASPIACYFLPDSTLPHTLVGISPLLRPNGRAIFTPNSVLVFDSPTSILLFLSGTKSPSSDLCFFKVPQPHFPTMLSTQALSHPSSHSANFILFSFPHARYVSYLHRAFCLHFLACSHPWFYPRTSPANSLSCPQVSPTVYLYFPRPLGYPTAWHRIRAEARPLDSPRPRLAGLTQLYLPLTPHQYPSSLIPLRLTPDMQIAGPLGGPSNGNRGVGEVVQGIGDASGGCGRDKDGMTTIVV